MVRLAYRSYVARWCSAQSLLDTIPSHAEIESVTMGDRAEAVRVTRSEIGIELISMRGERPLLVEIMGPAAAGKTSLVRALCSADQGIRAGLEIGRARFSGALVGKVGPLLPVWVLDHRDDRWFNRREIKSITFLQAWYRELEQQGSNDIIATIFDHGPVFRLARLKEFGPEITRSATFERWWLACRERWMDVLDLIIWVDAPDEILLQRVAERGHGYLDTASSGEDKHEFLARYRRAFAEILEQGSSNRPNVLRFRSDRRSVVEIADEVLAAIRAEPTPVLRHERSR